MQMDTQWAQNLRTNMTHVTQLQQKQLNVPVSAGANERLEAAFRVACEEQAVPASMYRDM